MSHLYDIAIMGASAAGLTAAWRLASAGRDVVVVDPQGSIAESPLSELAPADLFGRSCLPGPLARKACAEEFRIVRYHGAALDKDAEYRGKRVGWLVPMPGLVKALKQAATKAGARIVVGKAHQSVHLGEDCVQLAGAGKVQARLLLIASGSPNQAISELALPVRNVPQSTMSVAALEVPLPAAAAKAMRGVLHVIESPDRNEMGMLFAIGSSVHMRVISHSSTADIRGIGLSSLLSRLQGAGVIPQSIQLSKARGAIWHPPAGVALELETHVAKRCLLIGTAGGFADGITGQVLAPSIKSALLAADIAGAAARMHDPQETLLRFKAAWRSSLADSLRPPNTALAMLMPLLFVNKRIVGRFTNSLLRGEAI